MRVVNNDSFSKGWEYMLRYEKLKYSKKNIPYKILSLIIIYILLTLIPLFWKNYLWSFLEILPKQIVISLSLFFIHIIFHSLTNFVFFFFYKHKIPFFEQFRVNDKPWPWEKNEESWLLVYKKTLKMLFFQQYILFPLSIFPFIYFVCKIRVNLESFPLMSEMVFQIIFLMICDDFYNYWVHRLFHYKFLYKWIHKQHHEYVIPISISAEYAHPIEVIFLNLSAPMLGVLLLGSRMHFMTLIIWTMIKSVEPVIVHSGYDFPWDITKILPFSAPAAFHDFHHTHNIGNFSSFFTFWDIMLSSGIFYVDYLEKRVEKIGKVKDQGKK